MPHDSANQKPSPRAIHQAARAELEAQFSKEFCAREPFKSLHPLFLQALHAFSDFPPPTAFDVLAASVPPSGTDAPALPRFVPQDRAALLDAGGYEQHVAKHRAVPTRPRNWHDFFNMSVWAHFPRTRWALNAIHVDTSLGPVDPRNGRAAAQNVAAQLDESGIVVASSSPEILADLRALQFKRVFWERREELTATTRFCLIGHGTLESLLTPHLGLASKGVLLQLTVPPSSTDPDALRAELDRRTAGFVTSLRTSAPLLDPIPLLGIPHWAPAQSPEFYDNARYFRFERRKPDDSASPLGPR